MGSRVGRSLTLFYKLFSMKGLSTAIHLRLNDKERGKSWPPHPVPVFSEPLLTIAWSSLPKASASIAASMPQDIQGSIAHARMLATVGLLTGEEQRQIEQALTEIGLEIEQGRFPLQVELEDIHMHIEQALIDRLGDVGRKLHTGRSRNDQVSTDFRLWVRQAIDDVDQRLQALQRAFVERCQEDADVILPAYTHLQRAQPVLAAHYWLAYCEKLQRDRERLSDCRRRVNSCTLGTAAVAGTSLPIDRARCSSASGLRAACGQQHRRFQRPRFCLGNVFCPGGDRRASQRLGRGVDPVVDGRIRFPPIAAGVLHRLVDHAAEDQPGRVGVDPRQDRARCRAFDVAAGTRQGTAVGLQPRPAGGQTGGVRRGGHREELPGYGGPHGARARV